MQILIVGGSSGLGWELAKSWGRKGNNIVVTGRKKPIGFSDDYPIKFREFDVTSDPMGIVEKLGYNSKMEHEVPIDLFVYAAGFFQKGKIDDLSPDNIIQMINVGLTAPSIILNRILKKQRSLPTFMAITSTSQWTPRLEEPVYTAVKAWLGMLARSLSLDKRIGKTLVVGPAGMKTKFWGGTDKDTSTMLEPDWVAERILDLFARNYSYQFVRILRDPPRVETVDAQK